MPVNNRIDELVLSQLKKAGIPPSELCSDDVFLRRVYLDVTGTLPRPQETMSFLSDNSSDKRVLLIDKLLEREEYSDYWAMKWSDILRVKSEFPSNLWPNAVQAYHRWIKESLKNNLPYDRFAMALLTSSGSNFREEQTCSVFQLMNEALNQCGMQFQDVVRTWFFLDDILGWYTGFNRVRTDFFKKNIAMEKFLPASTGVGATNLAGAALTASAFAVKPKTELFTIKTVPSPMQSPASDYKSSFSRAVEITCPTHRLLHISGTASIDSEGMSIYRNDAGRQTEFTIEVIDVLLKSRGMDWTDSFRGIVYFKDLKDEALFRNYCKERQMPDFPLSAVCATICREELLFEIELDAVKIAD